MSFYWPPCVSLSELVSKRKTTYAYTLHRPFRRQSPRITAVPSVWSLVSSKSSEPYFGAEGEYLPLVIPLCKWTFLRFRDSADVSVLAPGKVRSFQH